MTGSIGKRIAVLGTGAIGSCIGADPTIAGEEVILIDQWPAHIEAMKSRGLQVIMTEGSLHTPVQAMHCCEVCTLQQPFDIVFLTAKSYDTRRRVQLIEPYLRPNGVLVSLQNSLNDEITSLTKRIEQGSLRPASDNLAHLEKLI
jgi:2-dehydropantoate 2-reductase